MTTQRIDPWRGMKLLPTQARFVKSTAKYRLYSSGYGGGKDLDPATPIPTPLGWRTLAALSVGDLVFDENGRPCKVTGTIETRPEHCYRVTFSDGTSIDASATHEWVTWDHSARKEFNRRHPRTAPGEGWPTWRSPRAGRGPAVRTTDEIASTVRLDGKNNHAIPVGGALELPDADLPIEPYVLGAWLGDGNTHDCGFTCHDDDLAHFSSEFWRLGFELRRRPSTDCGHGIIGATVPLRVAGVLHDKHVPNAYLWAGADQRLSLLQGLMDTDGHADGHNRNRVEFCSTNRRLAEAVVHLARSLGQKPVLAEGRARLNGTDHGPKYRVTWRPTIQVFRLARKAERIKLNDAQITRSHWRMIVSVEPITPRPMRCIEVDSPHSLYLAGEAMIPTHNSKLGCRCSIRRAMGWPHSRHLIGRHTYQDLTKTTMVTFWREVREIGLQENVHYRYSKADMTVRWWNGSETLFSNLDDPTGAKFGSLEISSAFIDEGSEVGSEVYQVLFPGRLRWHLPGCELKNKIDAWMAVNPDEPVPSTMRCGCMDIWQGDVCTNPGPSDYLMQVVEEGMPGWEVFHATPGENPYNGPEYYRELEEKGKRYGEHWYKRFFLGRWDAFEGQRFPMLDEQTHMLPESFTFNTDAWDFYEGWDFGWNNPTAVVVIAVHRNGDYPPCVVAEYEQNHLEPVAHAKVVREIRTEFEGTTEPLAYGDPAGLQTNTAGQTTLELYAEHGIYISPATWAKDPRGRADKLAAAFVREVSTPDGPMRGLMFHPRCQRMFRALTMYRFAPNRNKDADAREVFVKKNDHLVDALGYGYSGVFPEDEPAESASKKAWEADNKRLRRPTMAELDALELGAAR